MSTPVNKSYKFFEEKMNDGTCFTLRELARATGWSASTVETYRSKKWEGVLEKQGDRFVVKNLPDSPDEYSRMMSQKHSISKEYQKPNLEPPVESLVAKARQSAILALDVYNRPATVFKTEAFIVLMVIAWTALLHAIFEKRGIAYFYPDKDGDPKMVDGDKKAWELASCMKEYYGSSNPPVRENLQFMIKLRNQIEHRFSPEIDLHVAGECQAMLLNFDDLMVQEFGQYYAVQEYLCVPLSTSARRPRYQAEALRKFQEKQYDTLMKYIDDYRSGLDAEIYEDTRYSFRVFLSRKVGNHASSSDLALEFVKGDALQKGDQVVAYRDIKIPVANQGKLKPSDVAKKVEQKLRREFTVHNHTQAWRYYQVRESGPPTPEGCKIEYCQYDEAHKSYVYTPQWVDFLVQKLSDSREYEKVTSVRFN